MKFLSLLLKVAFLAAAIAIGNGTPVKAQQQDTNTMAVKLAVKPTVAPKVQVSATKPGKVNTAMAKETIIEPLPIEMPATVDHHLQAEESKPLAVTGFITKNGSIYEVEDERGIGQIQSRQTDYDAAYICNYGAVVIYSDVPCKEVTSVKVSKVEESPALEQLPAPSNNNDKQNFEGEEEDMETQNAQLQAGEKAKRPNKNGQKRPAKNGQKRPAKNGQKRPVQNGQNRPAKNGQKRPNKNGQKQPSKNGQKRPNKNEPKEPMKNNEKRPNKNKQKRPINSSQPSKQNYRRRWEEEEEEYDDDDYRYYQNQPKRQTFQQFQSYTSDYDDY